jgi:predicted oxidoreductase
MFRTDRLDALLLHRPDPLMDADEIAEAFLRLRGDGKVLSFGVSNFSPSQMGLLASRLPFPLSFNEIQASVLHPDPILDGTLDYCQLHGIIPMAWGPLGRGELFTGSSERVLAMRELLSRIGAGAAGTDGPGIDAVALAWLRMLPSRVVPILGTGTAEELRSCLRPCAVGREQWYSILCASTGKGLA